MSPKERRRMSVLSRVTAGDWTVKESALRMRVSYRQAKRIYSRCQARGNAGLVHGLRGVGGARRIDPGLRDKVVGLYRDHSGDFGCHAACEYLWERHGLKVDDQALRRWLAQSGIAITRRLWVAAMACVVIW